MDKFLGVSEASDVVFNIRLEYLMFAFVVS